MTLLRDFRLAFRGLLKDKAFAFVAVFTLALAIGANCAVFSVIDAVLLRPLSYKNPDRIVRVWEAVGAFTGSVSVPNLQDWRKQNTTFEALAAYQSEDLILRADPNPQRMSAVSVSWDFFKVLGVQPLLGRVFLPGEDAPGAAKLVILSEGLWRGQYNSNPGVIGQSVTLNGEPHTIVGIMPAYLNYPAPGTQVWVPLVPTPRQISGRGEHFLNVIGRLKPGVSIDQAQQEMILIARRLEQQYPANQAGYTVRIVKLQEQLVGNVRPTLVALFGAVGFVLLIACANVANLLLARSRARRREMALRTALGASRSHLFQQFLTESVAIALVGGLAGVVLAKIALASLVAWAGPYLPRAQEVTLDLQVLAFSIIVSLLTGVVCGIIPGMQSANEDIQVALKQGGTSTSSPQSNWTTGLLAIGEISASLVLLIGAGLLMKSILRLEHVDPGFQAQNVVTMKMTLPRDRYKPDAAARFYNELRQRILRLPGVQAVGLVSILPVNKDSNYNGDLNVEGLPHFVNDVTWTIEQRFVSPGYFMALNIPLVRGREFTESDLSGARVAVISEKYARMISQYGDPLGRHILGEFDDPSAARIEIVGIVGDVHQMGLDVPSRPEAYFLNDVPTPIVNNMNLVVRAVGDTDGLVAAIRHEIASLDPDQTAYDVSTMQTWVESSISGQRFARSLIQLFAILGTLLAVVGVYTVLSYLVTQHTREIGIRLALGAQRSHVIKLVLNQGVLVGAAGLTIGIVGALVLTRLMSSMLFEVKSYDLPTFAGASLLLFAVVLVASYVPARRTTTVDPMVALRQD